MMQTISSSVLCPSQNELGEGSFWRSFDQTVYWVDILGKKIMGYHWQSGEVTTYPVERRPSMLAEASDGHLLVAVQGGLMHFDPAEHEWEWFLEIESDIPENRSNDGACDSKGRLWLGTMNMAFEKGAGSLYRISAGGSVQRKLAAVTISNGIAWSKDNRVMYYIDTPTRCIQVFDFDPDQGEITGSREPIPVPESLGQPDGMTIDAEGMLWVALWGGFAVGRFDPHSGACVAKLELPVPQVSSCCFAGPQLDHLVITTARENMPASELEKYPLSGDLFIARPGVTGTRRFRFGAAAK